MRQNVIEGRREKMKTNTQIKITNHNYTVSYINIRSEYKQNESDNRNKDEVTKMNLYEMIYRWENRHVKLKIFVLLLGRACVQSYWFLFFLFCLIQWCLRTLLSYSFVVVQHFVTTIHTSQLLSNLLFVYIHWHKY